MYNLDTSEQYLGVELTLHTYITREIGAWALTSCPPARHLSTTWKPKCFVVKPSNGTVPVCKLHFNKIAIVLSFVERC